ncbi:MAG: KAP family NTPase [Candidatus Saccharibacteria bacterium]|nr:KAP family NTPase [Candidatus Saccharibacteria bacterium]
MYTEIDKLDRAEFVDSLFKIIERKFEAKTGFTFAIDGRWGCGKSFIVEMLEEKIKDKYLVIKYNCWKYDYYEEPVAAIMSVIATKLNQIASEENPPKFVNQDTFRNLSTFLAKVGMTLFSGATGIDLSTIVALGKDAIKGEKKENIVKNFDSMDQLTQAIEIIDMASSLAHCEKKVLFIVDELDRCLPQYAIKVLERLHHINEKTPFVTLLSINVTELSGSILKVFSRNENDPFFADYYLQKFTNLVIPVPGGNPSESLLDVFKLTKNDFGLDCKENQTKDLFCFLKEVLGLLPIRTIEHIDKQIAAIHALMDQQCLTKAKTSPITFYIAVIKVFAQTICKSEASVYIRTQNDAAECCVTIVKNQKSQDNFNESAFINALNEWNKSQYYRLDDSRGNFKGYTAINRSLKEDLIDYLGKNNEKIRSSRSLSEEKIYLDEFEKWLIKISRN